jgi:hypothetical protein
VRKEPLSCFQGKMASGQAMAVFEWLEFVGFEDAPVASPTSVH